MKKRTPADEILREFVGDINAAGGISEDHKGNPVLAADEEWVDLANTYLKACSHLGLKPKTLQPT